MQIETIVGSEPFYLTNTSSIPIGVLDQGAKLGGRIIGYHFYNPPAVQKLVELIAPATTRPEVKEVSLELAKRLRKTIVPANDVAGFIGNGHFMRDILHAASAVEKLESQFGEPGAIYVMNRVSQDFLLRPMGIFQLVDYVGVEVCQLIMSVMSEHIKGETLRSALIDRMVEKHVIGGQNPDGSQKDGFLKYERGRPVGVYDLKKPGYVLFEEDAWGRGLDEKIGALPPGHSPWKALLGDTKREEKLKSYFANLATCQTLGCTLAQAYMRRSKEIGEHLVSMRVANSPQDVNNVLTNGFFHLYGPVNDYV
jgi:3-hydroxyacyl-CoA dehydrogenase